MTHRIALRNTQWCKCMSNINQLPSYWALGSGCDGYVIMNLWRKQLGWSVRRFEYDERMTKIALQWEGVPTKASNRSIVKHIFPAGCVFFDSCENCPKRQ
jgi:hypothetical protein